jgi:murein tripeptide amidase MpaA
LCYLEWITPATCIWIVDKLIAEYKNNDPIIRELLDYWNVYVVPSLNPDGKKIPGRLNSFLFFFL